MRVWLVAPKNANVILSRNIDPLQKAINKVSQAVLGVSGESISFRFVDVTKGPNACELMVIGETDFSYESIQLKEKWEKEVLEALRKAFWVETDRVWMHNLAKYETEVELRLIGPVGNY